MHTLYLCYFGLREPLVQTQVLPYLRQIRQGGVAVSLLTFEPRCRRMWTPDEVIDWRTRLHADGIRWFSLPYHKRPSLPATLYDIVMGARAASRLVRRDHIDVLHARGHTAAAMGVLTKRHSGGRLLFDIRGFMPEEYADSGLWPPGGRLYRGAKKIERQLFAAADGFVVLTEKARGILFPGCRAADGVGRPLEVIPCCVDLQRFRTAALPSKQVMRQELGLTGRRVLVYVGSLGGWYLTDDMAALLAVAHRQDGLTFSMILTQSPARLITEPLRKFGVAPRDYLVRQVAPNEIPRYLHAADLALSFIKPCDSKMASSPTKIAEYLASGLPVLTNTGVGDLDAILTTHGAGVLVRDFGQAAYRQALLAAQKLLQEAGVQDRCRALAQRHFDLETVGGLRYRRLYTVLCGAPH